MRKFIILTVMVPLYLFAQISEDFSDGDFTHDPAWTGDLNDFDLSSSSAVPANQRPALQLNATEAGTSSVAATNLFTGELEWQFWVKLSLNTSSGNFMRFYLFSDQAGQDSLLHGYFLQVGGAEDSVIFYRQDSVNITRMLCLGSAFTGNSTNTLRFRVTRDQEGNWKFFADPSGGHSLEFQGEINDLAFTGGNHFGIYCQYTSSNTTKFYFDDLYAGPLIIDTVPPALVKVKAAGPAELLLTFSEAVDQESAEDLSNYEISPVLGHPYSAIRMLDPSLVSLFFEQELQNGMDYMLNISNVKDLAGNIAGPASFHVMYYMVKPYDLVFTEIMADPTPPRELPEYEYLELYNRSPYAIDLNGFFLSISSAGYELPDVVIDPGNYLVFCDEEAAGIMQHLCSVAGLASFTLPNSGAPVHLADSAGNTICYLEYDQSWYKDDMKTEGGWSVEMADPSNPCRNKENWMASVAFEGGTPGKENSVAVIPGNGIKIMNTCCINDHEIEIEFNESLDSLNASDASRYMAEPFLGHPDLAGPVFPGYRSVRLMFNQEISADQLYRLTVNPGLKNCIGEELPFELESIFALPGAVGPFDIIINEVLFNPLGDGVDYVEIFNRSEKTIALEELVLASVKHSPPNPPDTQSIVIITSCKALLPGAYLVLTSDPLKVKDQFYTTDPEAFLECSSFPSFNNDQGYVLLMNRDHVVIDGMNYTEDMHFLLLGSPDGVALERINPGRLGFDPSNWHSAAETAGFGTPGYRNSQYLEITEDDATLSLQPEVFSPDGDGREDHMGIICKFGSPGKLMTILIFNADGRLARTLVDNAMPGTEAAFSWDGTLDDRTAAQNGIYVIYMEALGMDGKTHHYKKAGVLARNRY